MEQQTTEQTVEFRREDEIGRKIKQERVRRGYSLAALARRANVSVSYVWRLENTITKQPSIVKLAALADALNISPSFFVELGVIIPEDRHLDESFYHRYLNLSKEHKEQMRKILITFENEHVTD